MMKKKIFAICLCMITLLLFSLPSFAGNIISVPYHYPTIQLAINAAEAGDTVLVRSGTYEEDVIMKDGVDLMGDYRREITVTGKITASSNAVLKKITVHNNGDEPVVDVASSNFLIEKCVIKNLAATVTGLGIRINSPSDGVIVRNTLIYVGNHTGYDRGVYLNQAGQTDPVTLESNTIHIDADPEAVSSEDTACIYSEESTYTARNNILTLNDPTLNAINANEDTPEITYNCILGKISPAGLLHKGTLSASPGYADAANGDFHLALAADDVYKSPSVAMDSGDPALDFSAEIQLASNNRAVDLGAYGNTRETVWTTIMADFTLDGYVNRTDYDIFIANFGSSGVTWSQGDANGDGRADLRDFAILRGNYDNSIYE